MEDMREEWEELMSKMQEMGERMKDKSMEGMEEMKMEWDKMMESANKMRDMMKEKM